MAKYIMNKLMPEYSCLTWMVVIMGMIVSSTADAQMTPYRAVEQMTCGINVGRSFDLDTGEPVNRLIQEYYFQDFKTAGFNFVRLPVQWNAHTGTTSPYAIDEVWMTRVEQVIDWSLKYGLITVINMHHDNWILENNSYTATDLARFDAIWNQIALRFKDKSDKLLFEIANEPNISINSVDMLNARAIPIIRMTNPTRNIIFGSSGTQFSTLKQAVIPNDHYLIASFHTYEPWAFAGQGIGTWGTAADISTVETMLADVAAWVETNDIPVLMGEFSAVSSCEINSRKSWFYTHMKSANRLNIAPCVWQDFGSFGLYYNTIIAANKWSTAVKDIIVAKYNQPAEALTVAIVNGDEALLTWNNRDTDYKSISIQRKEGTGIYQVITTLTGNAETYLDATVVEGKTYRYRVVSTLSTNVMANSFPAQVMIPVVPVPPFVAYSNIHDMDVFSQGTDLNITVIATHVSGIKNVKLYLNTHLVRQENTAPYDWGIGVNDPQLNTLAPGVYVLKALAEAASGDTASVTIGFIIKEAVTTDVWSDNIGQQVNVFPNPVSDKLYVNEIVKWQLFDMSGNEILHGYGDVVPCEYLCTGIYTWRTGTYSIYIIKQ